VSPNATALPLAGLTVVVTRPRQSAELTALALDAAGANAIAMPLLEISAISAPTLPLSRPPEAIIFVSSHAAEFGVPELSRQRLIANADSSQRIYAVGRATAATLKRLGIATVVTPTSGEDSEALLALPDLVASMNKTMVIAKGDSEGGGRQLLEDTLRGRGAAVFNLVCYRRAARALDAVERGQLAHHVKARATVLVGSIETLDSLEKNLVAANLGMSAITHLLVPHARVAAAAMAAGAPRVSVVSLEDNTLIESLSHWQA
jgi:uroporphyrinogen-III synthase